MTTKTTQRWSDTEETRRRNLIAAGIAPTFYPFWAGDSTGSLRATLEEFTEKRDVLLLAMDDDDYYEIVDQLGLELAYRQHGCPEFVADEGGAHPWCRDCGWQKQYHAANWAITDDETGDVLDRFATKREAEQMLAEYPISTSVEYVTDPGEL